MTRGEAKNQELKVYAITSILRVLDIDLGLTVSALATMAYVSIWTVFMILTEYLHNYVQCLCTTFAEGQ